MIQRRFFLGEKGKGSCQERAGLDKENSLPGNLDFLPWKEI